MRLTEMLQGVAQGNGTTPTKLKNENGSAARIEQLRAREKQVREALAAEQAKWAKQQARLRKRETEIIGDAVIKATALSPEFKLAVSQAALSNITDEKQRRFLQARGWKV